MSVTTFLANHFFLSLLFVFLVFFYIYQELKPRLLGFKDVKAAEAVRRINKEDAVVLDVREDKEYESGHIVNSVHIPLGLLESRLKELEKYREKPLIVTCRSGDRALKACAQLKTQGYQVSKLEGGILSWQAANLPLTKKR